MMMTMMMMKTKQCLCAVTHNEKDHQETKEAASRLQRLTHWCVCIQSGPEVYTTQH